MLSTTMLWYESNKDVLLNSAFALPNLEHLPTFALCGTFPSPWDHGWSVKWNEIMIFNLLKQFMDKQKKKNSTKQKLNNGEK